MRFLVYGLVVCCVCATATAALAASPKQLAVLNLRADMELDAGTTRTLNELLLNAFHESGAFVTLGMSDITSILTLENARQLLSGCGDDSCLAELGGALGVELVAEGSIGALGGQYVLSLKLINVARAEVLSRCSEVLPRDDAKLVNAIRTAVGRLVDGAAVELEIAPRPLQSVVEANSPSRPGLWIVAGLTLATAAGAGALGLLAASEARAARAELDGTPAWDEHRKTADRYALATDVLIGLSVASAAATVILFIAGRDDEPVTLGLSAGVAGPWTQLQVRF